jgi:dTDP-4-dehydrorhamnose reductase
MRLYVTGGTGLVGSHVIKIAQEHYNAEVIASLYGPPPEGKITYELDPLDLTDLNAVRKSVQKYKPDVLIHCAAMLDQVMMFQYRQKAWYMMVEGTRAIAEECRNLNARLVFVSSDWVFDGMEPLVDEDSPPFPVNFYGVLKFASERELSQMSDLNYAVGRLAGVYGENIANRSLTRRDQGLGFDLGNYIIKRLTESKLADVWMGPNVNDIAHPTLASDGAEMLLRLAKYEGTGIFHCMGSEAISRLEFAMLIADVFEYDISLVKPVLTDPEVLAAHANIRIPFRLRMSVEKTSKALGRRTMNAREGVLAFKQQWDELNR